MLFDDAVTQAHFLQRYWQKEPLLMRNALSGVQGLVTREELEMLARDDDVSSQLVTGDDHANDWRCEYGPFDAQRFDVPPRGAWTLLVRSVDQFVPAVHALLDRFAFLPRWRLDDVMISHATPGGGVGPHFDHYDVFLIQAGGTRTWRLGQRCDARTPLRAHEHLRLLADFDTRAEHHLQPGDTLYVPPGLAHWGTATSDGCITVSVGFRAPSHAEILQATAECLAGDLGEDLRYRDPPAGVDADPYLIDAAAISQVTAIWNRLAPEHVSGALLRGFGHHVTVPRNPDLVWPREPPVPAVIEARVGRGEPLALSHHPCSRFAYALEGSTGWLFVDGEVHETTPEIARGVCHGALAAHALADEAGRALLRELLEAGQLALSD